MNKYKAILIYHVNSWIGTAYFVKLQLYIGEKEKFHKNNWCYSEGRQFSHSILFCELMNVITTVWEALKP